MIVPSGELALVAEISRLVTAGITNGGTGVTRDSHARDGYRG